MNNMNLMQLDEQYLQIITEIEENDGALTPELEKRFDEACDMIVKKENGYIAIDHHIDSQIELGKKIIKRLQNRLKVFDNQKKRLKERLILHMNNTGKTEINSDFGKIKLQSTNKVVDLPIDSYPLQYVKTKTTQSVDKASLKKDAKTDPELEKFIEISQFIKIY